MPTVLLVEDEEKTASFLQASMSELGIQSDIVSDGDEAIFLLGSHDYDGVIIDLRLDNSKTQGLSVIEWMRKKGMFLPIIAVSAHPHLARRALELNVDQMLMKPTSGEHIVRYISMLMKMRKIEHELKKIKKKNAIYEKIIISGYGSYLFGGFLALIFILLMMIWRSIIPNDQIGIIVFLFLACLALLGSKRITSIALNLSKQKFEISAKDDNEKSWEPPADL